jgi:hypothetical protein
MRQQGAAPEKGMAKLREVGIHRLRPTQITVGLITFLVACAGGPPLDNPSAPGAMRPDVAERREARGLEQAESDCASQGKHAVSQRVEGETVYDCAD